MITIPTITQIRDQIIADIEAKIGQTVPTLPRAFFRVLATALAGVVALLYRFGAWVYDQIFPSTADAEALTRTGEQYGIIRGAAVAWAGTATATGASDTVIPVGTLWQADGVVYRQSAAAAIVAGSATISLEALTTGDATNLANASLVSLVTPLAGVDTDATVASTATTGEDAEALETYRARITQRLQQRPQGGATPDYVGWALEVAGIVRAFAFRTDAGEVTVYPLVALTGARIPDAAKLAEVEAYLQPTSRRPLCANVYAAAMTERVITPTITAVQPDNTTTREAVEAAWAAYLLRAFPAQYPDQADQTNIVSLAGLYAEALGAGARSITLTMTIDGVPGAIEAYTLLDSEIVKLGTVTWPV
jgi:uncharacterized phage protein gp47/JayE